MNLSYFQYKLREQILKVFFFFCLCSLDYQEQLILNAVALALELFLSSHYVWFRVLFSNL